MRLPQLVTTGFATALISIAFAACGSDTVNTTPPPQSPGTTNEVTVNIPVGAMNLGSAAFGQNPLIIPQNTKVTWVNQDTVAQTVTSTTGLFDSSTLNPGQSFSFTFPDAGTFNYFSQLYPSMTGTIQVTSSTQPSPSPSVSPTPAPTPTPSSSASPSPSPSASASPPISLF